MVGGVVWVVQETPGKNLLGAREHGVLRVLLPQGVQVMLDAGPAVEIMVQKLAGFSDNDCILAIGDPVAIGIACVLAARANKGRFRVLKWDRQEQSYFPVSVEVAA